MSNYINHSFYKLEKFNYSQKQLPILFNGIISCCYILYYVPYVERYNKIIENLNKICLCEETYICWNNGYKKTGKVLHKKKSNYDLIDSYRFVFHDFEKKNKNGNGNGYDYVLILEDDFILEDSIFNLKNIQSIYKYLYQRKNDSFIYSLGCIPHWNIPIPLPFYYKHPLFIKSTDSHANIYSSEIVKKINRDNNIQYEEHIDLYLNKKYWIRGYWEPLITQLKTETENTENWPNGLYQKLKPIYQYLELDKSSHNYILFYYYGRLKVLFFFFLFLILNLYIFI